MVPLCRKWTLNMNVSRKKDTPSLLRRMFWKQRSKPINTKESLHKEGLQQVWQLLCLVDPDDQVCTTQCVYHTHSVYHTLHVVDIKMISQREGWSFTEMWIRRWKVVRILRFKVNIRRPHNISSEQTVKQMTGWSIKYDWKYCCRGHWNFSQNGHLISAEQTATESFLEYSRIFSKADDVKPREAN